MFQPTLHLTQRIYIEKCAFCHGPDGRGNGASAPSMIPRPRDFTQGMFKYKTTPEGAPPSDDDLINVVTNGLHASGMPYFRGILSEAEIRDVVAYLKGFSKVFAANTAAPIDVPPRPTATPESIARGADLYAQSGCAGCHGDDMRGGQWMAGCKGLPGHQPRSHGAMDLSRRRCSRTGVLAALDRDGAGADAGIRASSRPKADGIW